MPELPEVETVVRALAPVVSGAVVDRVSVAPGPRWEPALEAAGQRLGVPYRRGKWIAMPFEDGGGLWVHLGMTGRLLAGEWGDSAALAPTRVKLHLVGAAAPGLRLDDVRGFGRVLTARSDGDVLAEPARLGPEPLDEPGIAAVATALAGRPTPIKAALLDQSVVAGVGNIYADEALFAARIHPLERGLGDSSARRLADALAVALHAGIEHGGTTLRDYRAPDGSSGRHQHHLSAYGRAGLPCVRCAAPMQRVVVAGRGTSFCARCQPPTS